MNSACIHQLIIMAFALLLCGGCQLRHPPQNSTSLPVPTPQQWTASASARSGEPLVWFDDLTDPVLAQLINEGIGKNFSLKSAAARVRTAHARARLVGADLLPVADLEFAAARRRTTSSGQGSINSSFGLNGELRWEVDLWNRLALTEQAAISEAAAAVADRQAAELSLAANIGRSWYRLTENHLQVQLAEQTEASYRQSLGVIEEQYRSGLTSALDLRLARTALTNSQAARAELVRIRDEEQRNLELLLGRYPAGEISGAEMLPPLRNGVPAGLPSTLLERRPDLQAAALLLEAAEQRSAAAQRNRLPLFQLTTSAGTASDKLYRLLDWDYLVWSLAGSVAQSVFDGGRRTAEQDIASAQVEQQLVAYADLLLDAFREVETTLVAEGSLQQQELALQLSVDEAVEAQLLAEQRYRQGLEGIITLLDTQRRSFVAQVSLLRTRRLRLNNRIDLHLALGGAFSAQEQRSEMRETP